MYRIGSLRKTDTKWYTELGLRWDISSINIFGVNVSFDASKYHQLNYEDIVKKITATIGAWKNRGLTLMGKFLIINSLIAALFTYKMSVLPKLSEMYIKRIEKLFNEFLWDGKHPKIALSTLQLNKSDGGLGLVNLRLKDEALKFAWVAILTEVDFVAQLAYYQLCGTIQSEIWLCNLQFEDVKSLFDTNKFCPQVLECWTKINYKQDIENRNEIMQQFIWYNSNIRREGKPFLFRKAYNDGL